MRAALSRASPAASRGGADELLAAVQDRRVGGVGGDEPLVLRGHRGAVEEQHDAVGHRCPQGPLTSGRQRRAGLERGVGRGQHPGRGADRRLGEDRAAHPEVVTGALEQGGQRAGLGEQVAAQGGEGGRLALGRDGLLGAARGDVDDRGDRGGDEDEDPQRQRVGRVADRQGAARLGEEPVDDERTDDGAEEGGPDASDECADDGEGEIEQEVERQGVTLAGGDEQQGQADERDDGERETGGHPTQGQGRRSPPPTVDP